jgi:hypothetical protein
MCPSSTQNYRPNVSVQDTIRFINHNNSNLKARGQDQITTLSKTGTSVHLSDTISVFRRHDLVRNKEFNTEVAAIFYSKNTFQIEDSNERPAF